MPMALMLLLCLACNNARLKTPATEAKDEFLSRQPANDAVAADSTAVAVDNEDRQPQIGGQHPQKNNPPIPAPAGNPDWDKKIVRTADLNVEVKNFRIFTDQLRKTVRSSGGYIAQEQQTQSVYKIENTVTIKVPVDRFEEALGQIVSDSDRLIGKKISSEDVTLQIIDTRSRLEAKKEVRERYLELLKQAKNMKDILSVQNEINEIQEQMEAASGRIAYLGHSAAFSTINLDFYQVLDAGAQEEPSSSFFQKIKGALQSGWDWCSSVVLGLISLWPLGIVIGLGWMWVRRWRTRKPVMPQPQKG